MKYKGNAPEAIKWIQKDYTCSFILFEFRNERDFGRASGGKWYWTGSAPLADTWLGTEERKPPFRVGNLHAHKAPKMNINHRIKDHTDQRLACDSDPKVEPIGL